MLKSLLFSSLVLCSSAIAASAATLTTTFAGGNGAHGNMFDIVVGPNDITIDEFELHISESPLAQVELYGKVGSHVGSESNPGDWTLFETGSVTNAGSGNPSSWDVSDFTLMAGQTYGIYLTATGANGGNFSYTNGTAVGNVAASNGDLTILEGIGNIYPFGSTFAPRIWNGSIIYKVEDNGPPSEVPLPAGFPLLAAGLLGLGLMRRKS